MALFDAGPTRRVLCLHGGGSRAEILRMQLRPFFASAIGKGLALDFECIEEFADSAKARTALAWAFDKVIAEARGTKIFVDKTGAPIARTAPKKRLRMIVGAH